MTRSLHDVRRDFLEFFRARGHEVVPGSPVVPHDDPTLLFTNAGMNQFKPLFLGQTGPGSPLAGLKRVANTQACIRAGGKHNDLDDVGHDTYHHTLFEMLGNWSFGDYFKREAIAWAWELLTNVWRLDKRRLYATYFGGAGSAGGAGAPGVEADLEARDLWASVTDIDPTHILPGGMKDNFWEMGETGPCGPCSEIHVDLSPNADCGHLVNAGDPRVIEVWNLVFIQFNRGADGSLTPLPARHVDTGMGLERIAGILQGHGNNYATEAFVALIQQVERLSGHSYGNASRAPCEPGRHREGAVSPTAEERAQPSRDREGAASGDPTAGGRHVSLTGPRTLAESSRYAVFRADDLRDTACRVIADHVRALVFAIADGCLPDKEGRGYVLRRILRRAVRYGWQYLGLHEPFLCKLAPTVVEMLGDAFPRLRSQPQRLVEVIRDEEESFERTLARGIALFEEAVARALEQRRAASTTEAPLDPTRAGGGLQPTRAGGGPQPTRAGGGPQPTRAGGGPQPTRAGGGPQPTRAGGGPQPSRDREGAVFQGTGANLPAAYLLTFHTYGTWLHGREEGSVDRGHNLPGEPYLDPQRGRELYEAEQLESPPVLLGPRERAAVEAAIGEVAANRGWNLHALHVRTNHVHAVVSGSTRPERILNDFKAYATRRLRDAKLIAPDAPVWSHHGSTRYLWHEASIGPACDYVREGQGDPLSEAEKPLPDGRGSAGDDSRRAEKPLPDGRGSAGEASAPRGVISGADAFRLHDTFGFPIDLTQIMAQERGMTVDISEYERLMEEARTRARSSGTSGDVRAALSHPAWQAQLAGLHNDFVGYDSLGERSVIAQALKLNGNPEACSELRAGQRGALILDPTPFYAEKGGQVGDCGVVTTSTGRFAVDDTQEINGLIVAIGRCTEGRILKHWHGEATCGEREGPAPDEAQSVERAEAAVDRSRRIPTQQNHTATHLLNWALREVLDRTEGGGYADQLQQKGSLVDPEKTRFDFSHSKALTPDEIERIERLVNEKIREDLPVFTNANEGVDRDAALKINGLRAVFGEKYPDRVRVVSIGVPVGERDAAALPQDQRVKTLLDDPTNPEWRKYSIEFCGGTHVKRTREVERFVLTAEEAVARGVRRLVGVSGQRAKLIQEAGSAALLEAGFLRQALTAASPAGADAEAGVARLARKLGEAELPLSDRARLRDALVELQALVKRQQKLASAASIDELRSRLDELIAGAKKIDGSTIVVAEMPGVPIEGLKTAADMIKQRCGSAAVLLAQGQPGGAGPQAGKVALLAAVTDDLVRRGVKAGEWVKAVAPIVEGGGGGPPTMAQAGGRNAARLGEALDAGRAWIVSRLAAGGV